ncbi:MAG: hypothetical protein WD595_01560 [Waddliaceae bacterium]
MKSRILSTVFSLLFIAGFSVVEGGFINDGIFKSKYLRLFVDGTLENNGSLIGTKSAIIKSGTLTGKGLIHSPRIMIRADLFNFRGTIYCEESCVILSPVLVDLEMFTFEGGGKLEFVIDPSVITYDEAVLQHFCPIEEELEDVMEYVIQ